MLGRFGLDPVVVVHREADRAALAFRFVAQLRRRRDEVFLLAVFSFDLLSKRWQSDSFDHVIFSFCLLCSAALSSVAAAPTSAAVSAQPEIVIVSFSSSK